MNTWMLMLAQAATGPANPAVDAPWWARNPIVPILMGLVVLYFFVFRAQRREKQQRANMLGNLKKGDVVQTIGGIIGKVMEAKETEVVLKVDESTNTKMRFARSAIHRVLAEEKA